MHQGKIPELDGVRGIAILLVLILHFEPPAGLPKVVGAAAYLGWSGVDLFFVLSGFLITGILLDTKDSPNYFSSFYARRVLRIFPLYLLSVLLYFHAALPAAHSMGMWSGDNNALEPWYWSHLSNWRSAFGFDIPMLSHFWSLAIEEQFYLVWPLVVFVLPRRFVPWACFAIAAGALGSRELLADASPHKEFLYRLTPFRLDPLAVGGLAAYLLRQSRLREVARRWLPWLATGAAAIFVLVLAYGKTNRPFHPPMATFGFTSVAALYGCLVFTAGTRPVSLLRHPFLRAFGKYSYGIYVFHVPITRFFNPEVARLAEGVPSAFKVVFWLATTAIGIALSYGVALISWNLIEKRFLSLKDRFPAAEATGTPNELAAIGL